MNDIRVAQAAPTAEHCLPEDCLAKKTETEGYSQSHATWHSEPQRQEPACEVAAGRTANLAGSLSCRGVVSAQHE